MINIEQITALTGQDTKTVISELIQDREKELRQLKKEIALLKVMQRKSA